MRSSANELGTIDGGAVARSRVAARVGLFGFADGEMRYRDVPLNDGQTIAG